MKSNRKILQLNQTLPEFFLDDVESRMETDPLTLGGLIDITELQEESCFIDSGCDCDGLNDGCTDKGFCIIHWY